MADFERWGEFQSAPGGEAGGNAVAVARVPVQLRFNPPPAVRPGGTCRQRHPRLPSYRFNPPPAVRPGGTAYTALRRDELLCFNPPPAVRPGGTGAGNPGWLNPYVSIRPRR